MTFTWRRGAAYLLIRYERTVREALRNPIQVLSSLTEKSKNESYRFQRLYRNLYNPEFYWLAYKNIYANTGSMTAGADGTTIDGMSDERIQRIIESMRDKSYLPKPARREYIAKKNSNKKRPLGIQSGNDKLVQEVVKMILESIYEPVFKKTSHGFRPNKSCQTALYQIQKTFTGTNWFVEGDIHACFDSFNHHTIIRLLRKRIDDEMFLQLIWKFLKAGYMEQWTYNRTYSGVPQGSGVSPVLANVYLHELDKFMEEYAQKYNRGKKKQMNSDYKKVVKKASYYRCMGKKKWADLSPEERWERNKHLKMLEKQTRQLTPTEPLDETYKRIQYTRYADDFIIGVIGSKADAEQMKADVGRFLREELDLEMSETKTKVTHTGDRARFLGYDITVSRSQDLKKSAGGYKIRSNAGVVKLLVPREKWVGKLLEYHAIKIKINENGKERFVALHRGKLVNQSDIEILARYNAEVRGLYNYYAIANDSFKMLYCYFSKLGYTVYTATAGNAALKEVEKKPDIILLDVNMPDIDGFTVCERIRDYVSCPIIFLTARIEDSDKIKGFSIGADDYVIKPFSVDELEARIAAHLRREKRHNTSSKVQFDEDMVIDYSSRIVFYHNKDMAFTKKEFDIISFLSQNKGIVFDRETIYEKVWGLDGIGDNTVVTEHIRRIRAKFLSLGDRPYIETVWGCGYKWKN